MADNKELQKKAKQFAEGMSGYKRAKRLVWGCGIGLWVLICVISLIVFDVQFRAAWNNSESTSGGGALGLFFGGVGMFYYGFWIAIFALGVIMLAGCVATYITNSKGRKKMTAFIKEAKDDGYSREEIGRSLLTIFSEKEVGKGLDQVFGNDRP